MRVIILTISNLEFLRQIVFEIIGGNTNELTQTALLKTAHQFYVF